MSFQPMTAEDKAELMQTTGEMLGIPFLVCRYRRCRRGPRCTLLTCEGHEPWCLALLRPWERAAFDELYAIALDMLGGRYHRQPSTRADVLALEQAAIEIVEATFAEDYPAMRLYRTWKKAFLSPPASSDRLADHATVAKGLTKTSSASDAVTASISVDDFLF